MKPVAEYGPGSTVNLPLREHWLDVHRIVISDSAFASQKLLIALLTFFIMAPWGAIKTAYTGFPKN